MEKELTAKTIKSDRIFVAYFHFRTMTCLKNWSPTRPSPVNFLTPRLTLPMAQLTQFRNPKQLSLLRLQISAPKMLFQKTEHHFVMQLFRAVSKNLFQKYPQFIKHDLEQMVCPKIYPFYLPVFSTGDSLRPVCKTLTTKS